MSDAVLAYTLTRSSGLDPAPGHLGPSTSGEMTRRGLVAHPRFFRAERSGLGRGRVRATLTQLGTAGRVGYDVAEAVA